MHVMLRKAGPMLGWVLDGALLGTVVGLVVYTALLLPVVSVVSLEELVDHRWQAAAFLARRGIPVRLEPQVSC